jgi:hypothetical protein
MARQKRAELWQEIASARLGEPVIASVILMRKGMVRNQMLSGLNPVDGVLGGVVDAVVEAGVEAVKQQLQERQPLKPIAVDGYAYVALGAITLGIIKPAQALTTADALRRGKVVLRVPRTVSIKLTVGKGGFFYRPVTLAVSGFAPTAFQANRRNWSDLQSVAAALQ